MTALVDERLSRARNRCMIAGAVALVLSVIGAAFSPLQFFVSYLFSYLFWLGLAMGCIIIAMIHYLTGGLWGHPVRRFLEAGFSTLPLLAVLFVPLLFGLHYLYPWTASSIPEVIAKKQPYLTAPWFIARFVVIFAIWLVLALRLRHWSLAQDETDDQNPARKLAFLSGPGLVLVPITATFAYVDWIMSLEAKWYSTVFAIVLLAGQVLAAYCFAVVLLKCFERTAPIASWVSVQHYHQLGNLLLTFVLFWSYVAFGQLLITYSGNEPDEISWYLHRLAGGWQYVLGAIALFHFFAPFILLLFRGFKRKSSYLASLALAIMVIHLVYSCWVVCPSIFTDGIHLNWLNFIVPIGLGGIWLGGFIWLLQRAPLVPLRDPRILEERADAEH